MGFSVSVIIFCQNSPFTIPSSFFIKSLMDDLVSIVEPLVNDLYYAIWLNHFPKKIKIFLWELCLGVVNIVDHSQHRIAYMSISSSSVSICFLLEL